MGTIIVIILTLFGALFGLVTTPYTVSQSQPVIVQSSEMGATEAATPAPETVESTAPGTGAVEPTSEATACPTQSPAPDVASILQLVPAGIFDPTVWKATGAWQSDRTSATWLADSLGAVAYVEYLHFDCGASQTDIDQFFSPAGFRSIFSGYDMYRQTAVCQASDLKLYEFDVTRGQDRWHVLFWIKQVSPTRVFDFVLTFPSSSLAQQAKYAQQLFPTLPSCKPLTG